MTIGIAVKLKKDFSIIRETLERIGIKNTHKKCFYPSCYCVETKVDSIYRIVHFKELFTLSDRETTFSNDDQLRLNTVVVLMVNWRLIDVIEDVGEILVEKLTVLKHTEKPIYSIVHKYKFNSHIVVD